MDKTGTTSVEKFLIENDSSATSNTVEIEGKVFNFNSHMTALEIKSILGKYYSQFTVIGFVRNPFSRVVSSYFFYKKGAKHWAWKGREKDRPIIQHLQIKFAKLVPFKIWALVYPYRPNKIYFLDEDEKLIVDKIGHFENLSDDLQRILLECGLNFDFSRFPHTNKSNHEEESQYFKNRIFNMAMSLKLRKDLAFYRSLNEQL